jgi:hypothetical protein
MGEGLVRDSICPCGELIIYGGFGRPRRYCSQRCKSRAAYAQERGIPFERPSVSDRFWSKVQPSPRWHLNGSSCWIWHGTVHAKGYGRFWLEERMVMAHRFAFEDRRAPIPDGLELDHLCRRPRCVRPDHLEPVTTEENHARAVAVRQRDVAGRWVKEV